MTGGGSPRGKVKILYVFPSVSISSKMSGESRLKCQTNPDLNITVMFPPGPRAAAIPSGAQCYFDPSPTTVVGAAVSLLLPMKMFMDVS